MMFKQKRTYHQNGSRGLLDDFAHRACLFCYRFVKKATLICKGDIHYLRCDSIISRRMKAGDGWILFSLARSCHPSFSNKWVKKCFANFMKAV